MLALNFDNYNENDRIFTLQNSHGGMAERLKAAVLKIASREIVTGVRIPLPPFFQLAVTRKENVGPDLRVGSFFFKF